MDKTGRNGIRVGDTTLPDFKERYQKLVQKHKEILSHYEFEYDLTEKESCIFRSHRIHQINSSRR